MICRSLPTPPPGTVRPPPAESHEPAARYRAPQPEAELSPAELFRLHLRRASRAPTSPFAPEPMAKRRGARVEKRTTPLHEPLGGASQPATRDDPLPAFLAANGAAANDAAAPDFPDFDWPATRANRFGPQMIAFAVLAGLLVAGGAVVTFKALSARNDAMVVAANAPEVTPPTVTATATVPAQAVPETPAPKLNDDRVPQMASAAPAASVGGDVKAPGTVPAAAAPQSHDTLSLADTTLRETDAGSIAAAAGVADASAIAGMATGPSALVTPHRGHAAGTPAMTAAVAEADGAALPAAKATVASVTPKSDVPAAKPTRTASAASASKRLTIPPGPAKTTAYVNLRDGPSNKATVLAVIPTGAPITVKSCNFWCQVQVGTKSGWLYQSFVAPVGR